ncbi:alpha/beta-hydrolase [Flagelloscypha sp. PMI_526]|nr:alpha/beta-hydrolase [Flagelloscypha sp. PMI_526]
MHLPFIFALGAILALPSAGQQIIDLGYTRLLGNSTTPTGIENGNVTFFGGVRYAKPPLGDLRWRAPQRLDETLVPLGGELFDARGWGNASIQKPARVDVGSEDCLNLAIWKPTNATRKSRLPVAVYIHGGGFYANAPKAFPLYDWVSQNNSIIGVSITYRLGDGDLNVGLLDQRAAIEWVKRHIAAFGGDPDKITIYGESAGAASVVFQLVAYGGSKPVPFRAAVIQSIGERGFRDDATLNASFANITKWAGCTSPTGSGSESLACLRTAPLSSIVDAINNLTNNRWDPVPDGPNGFLPDIPAKLVKQGRFAPVDVIVGVTSGDGKTFCGGKPEDFVTENDIRTKTFSRWLSVTNETQTDAIALYIDEESIYDKAWNISVDIIFDSLALLLAEMVVKMKRKAFAFLWNAPNTVQYQSRPWEWAGHTSDIYFLFDANAENSFTPFNETEAALSQEAIAYWTSFAIHGDPNPSRLSYTPVWEPFAVGSERKRLVISESKVVGESASGMEVIAQIKLDRAFKFWMSDKVLDETKV